MAFDGVVISNIVRDMRERLIGGRIYKIYQPEADELNIVVKNQGTTFRVMLNSSASLPLVYFLDENKSNPMKAPSFCMLLRKHVGNGRITDVRQPDFERIIELTIEHLDDMGDVCQKKLVIELMGKYSNIIFTDSEGKIIDSIKRIGSNISSVREVLPGREYVLPPNDKYNPLLLTEDIFKNEVLEKPLSIVKAIYSSITGISKEMAEEICYEAGVDGNFSTDSLAENNKDVLWKVFASFVEKINSGRYEPCIVYNKDIPIAFSAMYLRMYEDLSVVKFDDVSEVLSNFYAQKDVYSRMHQKSTDLRKVLSSLVERTSKKYDILLKQLKDVEKRDKYRLYGELLQAYGHEIKEGDESITVINYYDGNEITIPLDGMLTAANNANKYFDKYNKMKRTYEASLTLVKECKQTLNQLLLLQNSIEIAGSEADINEIRQEMTLAGFLKEKKIDNKGKQEKSNPLHFVSSDGFHMYVGKNNLQNDRLTFKTAGPKDLWFHAKEMPGSHVIVKLEGADDVPDNTYEEAARLAAYYSTGKTSPKVEIDYTRRGNLKKPPESNPGYVIYHTNYSMVALPDISGIEMIKD